VPDRLSRRRFLALAALGAAGCRSRVERGESSQEPDVDVAIVGAGLAGLAAAHRLIEARFSVVILEARERVGGRVLTLREPFAHGQHAEAGGIFVPSSHAVTRRYLGELELELLPAFPEGSRSALFLRGRLLGLQGFEEPPVELRADERGQGRRGLSRRYVFSAPGELGDLEHPDWSSPAVRHLDELSFADLLRERGASEGAVELLGLGYFQLLGDGIETVSALQVLRDLQGGGFESERIAGGSSRLPEALAEPLGERIRFGTEVVALEQRSDAVVLRTRRRGETRALVARRAILTLPTTLLRRFDCPGGLSRAKRRALDEVGMTSVTRTYLQGPRRAWGELASVDTDLAVQQLMDATGSQPGEAGILESYASGPRARELDALAPPARIERVEREVERVFPGSAGLVECAATHSWDQEPFTRGGYAWFRPEQLAAHLEELRAPEGRLHFAGEHTSAWSGWMQGALESGERAAREAEEALRG
jgi:monoamine oxidase